jgi:hypothetical protein
MLGSVKQTSMLPLMPRWGMMGLSTLPLRADLKDK